MSRSATVLCAALVSVGLLLAGCSGRRTRAGPERRQRTGQHRRAGKRRLRRQRRGPRCRVRSRADGSAAWLSRRRGVRGVQSLTVNGETMVLRLVVTPDFASAGEGEVVSLGDAMDVGSEFFGVQLRLLDRQNLKEYSVIVNGNDWWASSSGEVGATNGEPMYAFAVFAAPEDDIDTIDVRLNEQWPEFTDVPISR